MRNNMTLPTLNISFKLNELQTLINGLNLDAEAELDITIKINEIHEQIRYVHDNRQLIVHELHKLANTISINYQPNQLQAK